MMYFFIFSLPKCYAALVCALHWPLIPLTDTHHSGRAREFGGNPSIYASEFSYNKFI